ncbi:hypothetical protein HHI36_019472 [Cryptolaemus montrouzieri]|uniref:Uncharacterized protein n=1 Tax=Cryptolaemus montrouzieri TaxID=559131 RepID=A0ABD2P309_9CUCU
MFFRKSRRESKAKLEHKLYLAKETPEPIFDLSDCGIRDVPQGIFSICRVFLKVCLRLDSNNLASLSGGGNLTELRLLKILNISHNNFSHLPDELGALVNLQELHAILDVSYNNLKQLPEDIGDLVSLKKLDLIHNNLKQLPTSICGAQRLTHLTLDTAHFEYPPQEVVERGLEALMQYICDDTGIEYKKVENLSDVLVSMEKSESYFDEDDKQLQVMK